MSRPNRIPGLLFRLVGEVRVKIAPQPARPMFDRFDLLVSAWGTSQPLLPRA